MLTHKGTVTLTTPRLILRRFTMEDAPAMYANWATDEKVVQYLSWEIHESVEVTKEVLARWIAEYEKPEYYHWVIEYDDTIVGAINFHNISGRSGRCELGYNIGSKWWNEGIVTEAVTALLRFAFEELGAHKIVALHDAENIGSGRVMQKNGMKPEGLLREHSLRRNGTWGDLAYYGILRREWEAGQTRERPRDYQGVATP